MESWEQPLFSLVQLNSLHLSQGTDASTETLPASPSINKGLRQQYWKRQLS